ncbi:MAG: GntR family transcriptional regulator [Stutzerimonas stutzeri]|nr:MAG: GntR family transcriptional regulator [Stutzerimonas stutzeri]
MADKIAQSGRAPACPGPDPNPRGPTRFHVPAGAVDTHAHVIGEPPAHPFVAERSYTPPAATAESYLRMLDAAGITRGVLVQVSVHGRDNRLMVETLQSDPRRLRGIAVVGPDTTDGELEYLASAGVRGCRFNVLFGGGTSLDDLERLSARVSGLGWHVQLLVDARALPELGPRLLKLPVEVVFDHMGHVPARAGTNHPGFLWLQRLLKEERAWVKLSGAYRVTTSGAPYHDTIPFAQALIEAAPDRCVWGSDWPHVAVWEPMPNVGDLLDLLPLWAPDESVRHDILVRNPERLYGFGAS